MEDNKFSVIDGDNKYDAYVISNFSVYDDNYCVYAVDKGNDDKEVYCDRVINNSLIKIINPKEVEFTSKIVNILLSSVKDREVK